AMARHDDGERVSSERLPDVARETAFAEPRRDLPVRERRTRRNAARDLVDAAIEFRHAVHVERRGGKIARLPAQQRDDAVDPAPHVRRRQRLVRMRISPDETRAGPRLARLRQLHAGDAAPAPCDAALADIGIEERKAVCRHGPAILAAAVTANISDLARYSAATRRAPRTPRASSATRVTTTVTVFAVALSSRSRLALSAFTSAEPTTTPSAPAAITAACSAVRTPKPTATGSLVWRLMRSTAAATFVGSGVAAPVMPVIET